MSSGDDEPADVGDEADADADAGEEAEGELEAVSFEAALAGVTDPLEAADVDADALNEALDAVEEAVAAAETEADLDDVEAAIDDIEGAIEAAELPEPEGEDDEDPREALEGRVEDARAAVEAERGPYASEVVESAEATADEIEGTRWTDQGEADLVDPVAAFVSTVNEELATDLDVEDDAPDRLAVVVRSAATAVDAADLDPDDDAALIATLVEAAEALTDGVDAAEAWDDLTTREKLQAEGFYDILGHNKDYPPEWGALKAWEQEGNAEMVLLALEHLGSDFMEQHCLDALRRLGDEAALEPMLERAGRRDQDAIEILGKIGSPDAVDTIVEYVETDSDPALQQRTLKALGEIGDPETTQAVADRLASDNPLVRSAAARALGLIGDPRAIDPLAAVVADDAALPVRGAAAWALVQIGTAAALEAVAEFADDAVPLVQVEAETASTALGA